MSMIPLIIYIFAFFFSLALGIFVLRAGRKIEHKLFGLLSLIIMLWILFNILMGVLRSITFTELTYSAAALMTPVALIWFEYFTKQHCNKKYLAVLIFLGTIFFIVPLIDKLIIYDVHNYALDYYTDGKSGVLLPFYTAYQAALFILLVFRIIQELKKSTTKNKLQLKIILFGVVGFAIFPLVFSLLLPLVIGYNHLVMLQIPASLIFLSSFAYAILRHRLFDLQLIIRRGVIYGASLFITLSIFIYGFLFLKSVLSPYIAVQEWQVLLLLILAVTLFFDTLKNLIRKVINRFWPAYDIDLIELLSKIEAETQTTGTLNQKIPAILENIARTLQLESAALFIRLVPRSDEQLFFYPKKIYITRSFYEEIWTFFETKKQGLLARNYYKNYHKQQDFSAKLKKHNISLVLPLEQEGIYSGLLLVGNRKTGEAWGPDELRNIDGLRKKMEGTLRWLVTHDITMRNLSDQYSHSNQSAR